MYGAQLCSLNAIELLHITNYYHIAVLLTHILIVKIIPHQLKHTLLTVLLTIEGKCQIQIVEWVTESYTEDGQGSFLDHNNQLFNILPSYHLP